MCQRTNRSIHKFFGNRILFFRFAPYITTHIRQVKTQLSKEPKQISWEEIAPEDYLLYLIQCRGSLLDGTRQLFGTRAHGHLQLRGAEE